MAGRRFTLLFVLAALLPVPVVGALVWAVDPYQHFRPSDRYPSEARYLMPGVARNYPYEAIVIGSSHTSNFVNPTVSDKIGLKTQNLSVLGASYWEQRQVLEVALRTHRVKEVIWGIVPVPKTRRSKLGDDFPAYLYDDNPFNDVRYLFNLGMLTEARRMLLDADYAKDDPNLFYTWFRGVDPHPDRKPLLAAFHTYRYASDLRFSVMRADFDANILSVIRAHRDVHFTAFLTPFAALYYATLARRNPEGFPEVLRYQHYVLRTLSAEPNVTLHSFNTHAPLISNLDNYTNANHFSLNVSNWITEQLRTDAFRVRPGDADALMKRFLDLVAATPVPDVSELPADLDARTLNFADDS